MEPVSFTPFVAIAASNSTDPEGDLDHVEAKWGLEDSNRAEGIIKLNKNGESLMIGGIFIYKNNKVLTLAANSTSAKTFFYPAKEAGERAKKLEKQKFDAVNVVYYAISDVAFLNNDCTMFFRKGFKNLTKEEPGAIIVGNDGKHCGIVDNEGTSFVHSDPKTNLVAIEKIVKIKSVFKNGFTYKKCPERPDPELLY
eukprot:TRINITY_DN528_c0_g1_i8.p1 TRINITY_DN528_c0_g1~~TRINITY_DN528_c0_g1_i8.p1  ORF type:complete len:197 (-),score=60.77 TRINITY_DN528_c0_g1_i8:150-740(-)